MSVGNIVLLCFVFLSVVFGFSMAVIYAKREILLHKRAKINYNNYYEMRGLFNIKNSPVVLILGAISILFNIVVSCCILYSDALKIYLILLGLTLVLNTLGIASYISSVKYNRNLKEFDDYHSKIESSYVNKNKIVDNIKTIDMKYQTINSEIQKMNKKLSELVSGFTALPNVNDCYEPLEKLKKEQEDVLLSFDDKMPGVFTVSLLKYLKDGGQISAGTYIFNPDIDLDVDSIVSTISNILKNKYLLCIQESFLQKKYKNVDAVVEMVNILNNFDMFEKTYVDILVETVESNPEKTKPLISLMFERRYIDYGLINKCVKENKEWIFEHSITGCVSQNELTTLIADIINKNNMNITNKFLMFIDKSAKDAVKNGIGVATANNESSVIMERYIELLELDGGFNNLSNRYENIALSLNNYFNNTGIPNSKLFDIIYKGEFYENKSYLDSTYSSTLFKLEPLLMKTFKSMLYFSLHCSKNFTYFSQQKINSLYIEYKRQLNVTGLLCLSSLLDAVIFANVNESAVVELVKSSIETLSGDSLYENFYPVTGNKIKNLKLYGKDIIQNLFKNNREELSTLINHIENERLVLDKIRYM